MTCPRGDVQANLIRAHCLGRTEAVKHFSGVWRLRHCGLGPEIAWESLDVEPVEGAIAF